MYNVNTKEENALGQRLARLGWRIKFARLSYFHSRGPRIWGITERSSSDGALRSGSQFILQNIRSVRGLLSYLRPLVTDQRNSCKLPSLSGFLHANKILGNTLVKSQSTTAAPTPALAALTPTEPTTEALTRRSCRLSKASRTATTIRAGRVTSCLDPHATLG